MFRIRPLAFAAALTSLASLACVLPAQAQLPEPVAQVARAQGIAEDGVSALVLRDERTVLSHLADRPMQPASTMKLVTTLVGLETLGPVFRGRTELLGTGEVRGDTLHGDLVLRGGADVDLTGEVLETMLRELRNAGIRKIAGKLVVDRQLFNPARADLGVPPFDESPDAYYNVIPDAALVNRNMLQLDMRSTGTRLKLAMQPELEGVSIASDMKLVDADCSRWEDGWKQPEALPQKNGGIKLMLHGTFPKNCTQHYSINVIDRQDYVARLLRRSWKKLGGSFVGADAGKAVEAATPVDAKLLAEHVSRTLPEIIRDTNKPSDNLLARLVFLSLGSLEADPLRGSRPRAGSAEPTLERSTATVRTWMQAHGIQDAGMVIENGSGLSRIERVTAIQMGALLQAGLRSNWAPELMASMPIAGVDGTMRRRLQASPAGGRARMKTGTMHNVVALAGYVPDATGKTHVLVAFVNSEQAGNGHGRAVVDALVDWVAHLNGPAQPVLSVPGQALPNPAAPAAFPAPQQPAQPVQPAPATGQGQNGVQPPAQAQTAQAQQAQEQAQAKAAQVQAQVQPAAGNGR